MQKFIEFILSFFRRKTVVPPTPKPDPIPEPIPVPVPPPVEISPQEKLYNHACSLLGVDASPSDVATDEYGCAETICEIIHGAFGDFPVDGKTIISTTVLYNRLRAHPKFKLVTDFGPGDVLVSPTGFGNGSIKNGHTGIVGLSGSIMSNDSATGLFKANYTIDTWVARYRNRGGFPLYFFRRTAP